MQSAKAEAAQHQRAEYQPVFKGWFHRTYPTKGDLVFVVSIVAYWSQTLVNRPSIKAQFKTTNVRGSFRIYRRKGWFHLSSRHDCSTITQKNEHEISGSSSMRPCSGFNSRR